MDAIAIRRIESTDVRLFKALRLHALADSPEAFGSTLERERSYPDDVWQAWTCTGAESAGCATFVATTADEAAGMVMVVADSQSPERAEIFGMWVAPDGRRTGTGLALVEAAATWAVLAGMAELSLMVVSTNEPAIRLYEKAGFSRSGVTKPMPRDGSLLEIEMVRRLR